MYSTPFSELSKEQLQILLNESKTKAEVLEKLGHDPKSGGSYRTLKKYIEIHAIDLTYFDKNHSEYMNSNIKTLSRKQIRTINDLKYGEIIHNRALRRILLENELLPYCCALCGQTDTHNGLPLTLQLDHKDGDNKNNVIDNLRFLCPNCHTQTPTYGRKNPHIKKKKEQEKKIRSKKIKEEKDAKIEEMRQLLLSSDIDFSKHGWVSEAAKLLDKHPQKINQWMKLHMSDFYKEFCFKRKNSWSTRGESNPHHRVGNAG